MVANAERYYRAMYYGSAASWNLRDTHMFETLEVAARALRARARAAIVWEHNSHVGNARATEMSARGELNVGQLCRATFGDDRLRRSASAPTTARWPRRRDWDGPMERKQVRPAHADSYERLCHDSGVPAFTLHLRAPRRREVRDELPRHVSSARSA